MMKMLRILNPSLKSRILTFDLRKNLKVRLALIQANGAILSSRIPIGYINIRTFVHATEDPDKVVNAIRNLLPKGITKNADLKKSNLTGHHRNKIIILQIHFTEKNTTQAVFNKLASSLNTLDKELLNSKIKQHLERGNLYLRFDKQSAYLNEYKLSSADPIHFKIHFKKRNVEEILEICRKSGLLP